MPALHQLRRAVLPSLGRVRARLPQSASIVSRWSADDIPPQPDNGALASWADSVGGAVATTTGGVAYRTNRLGGKPSVQFTGGMARMEAGRPAAMVAALDGSAYTIMAVVQGVSSGAANGSVIGTAGGNALGLWANGSVVGRFANNNKLQTPASAAGFTTIGYSSATGSHNGSGAGLERAYVQGGCTTSSTGVAPGTAASNLAIGNIPGGSSSFGLRGEILDILVWSRELTPIEVLQFQRWACDKYGQPYPWAGAGRMRLFDGDSITAGVGITGANTVGDTYPYKVAQSLGLPLGAWSNLGIGGITMANMAAKAPAEVDAIAGMTGVPTHLMVFEWYNQKGAAPAPANTTYAYLAARAAAGITRIALGTSTSEGTNETNRGAYNSDLATNYASHGATAIVNIHADSTIGVTGAYANTTYFSDGVHPTAAGYTVLAGLVAPVMGAL